MVQSPSHSASTADAALNGLAVALDSVQVIACLPALFVNRVAPFQSGDDAATIRKLIDKVLWPMARESIAHPIMNRVRLTPHARVLPYRILIAPLLEADHSCGFFAALRRHEQKQFTAADLAVLKAAIPDLHARFSARLGEAMELLRWPEFQLEVASRSHDAARACVVYLNLDQMHVVNEISGFAAGDEIIRKTGCLLRAVGSDQDIARSSGYGLAYRSRD